jgi:hypothetical protein
MQTWAEVDMDMAVLQCPVNILMARMYKGIVSRHGRYFVEGLYS